MAYGIKIISKNGIYQFDGTSINLTLHSAVDISLRSGNYSRYAWDELAWFYEIATNKDDFIYAVSSPQWVRVGYPLNHDRHSSDKLCLIQELNASAGNAKVYTFRIFKSNVLDNFGLMVAGDFSRLDDSLKMLKILKIETLSSNTRSWSFDAPAGRKIAIAFSGGEQLVTYEKFYSDKLWRAPTFRQIYGRVINNGSRAELSFLRSSWERVTRIYQEDKNRSLKTNLTVVVIDVTDL